MENENRRLAWVGGIIIVGVAVLLGWLVLTKKEKTPATPVMPPAAIGDTLETPSELPAQEPPAQPQPQIVVDVDGKYTVQVSSWRTRRRAEQDAQRFVAKGFNAYIQSADLPELGGTWYRVRVGSYANRAEARELAAKLAGLLESGYWLDRYQKQ